MKQKVKKLRGQEKVRKIFTFLVLMARLIVSFPLTPQQNFELPLR